MRAEFHPHVLSARFARKLRFMRNVIGFRGLVNRLIPRDATGSFRIKNANGWIEGDLRSYIERESYLFGHYEEMHLQLFRREAQKTQRRVVLDIGANIGTHSAAFARMFGHVHAFEPNAQVWPSFERNMALNELRNVTLHRVGLGKRSESATLYGLGNGNHGLGTFSNVEQYDKPIVPLAEARMEHGDAFIEKHRIESIDAIKIDVQGFEPEVLAGLRRTLEEHKPLVWLEVGTGTLTAIKTRADLAALFPYPVRARRMTQVRHRAHYEMQLEEPLDLPDGDYLVTAVF